MVRNNNIARFCKPYAKGQRMKTDRQQLERYLKVASELQPIIWFNELDWELREYVLEARLAIFDMVHKIKHLQDIEDMLRAELNRFDNLSE